jgi:uncharacterized Zn-binding protein involved in type VI secretion
LIARLAAYPKKPAVTFSGHPSSAAVVIDSPHRKVLHFPANHFVGGFNMGFAFIREGDSTSHGGRVLACSPENESDGKPIALLGDMVSCPRCGGIFPIVNVKRELNMTFDGRPVATEGDQTACGATLIASASGSVASPTGGPIGHGLNVLSQRNSTGPSSSERGRFQVLDEATGRPIPNHPYVVKSGNGRVVSGRTDDKGYTDWLETDSASSLTFDHPGTSGT